MDHQTVVIEVTIWSKNEETDWVGLQIFPSFQIKSNEVGFVIGKGGAFITKLRNETGCEVGPAHFL